MCLTASTNARPVPTARVFKRLFVSSSLQYVAISLSPRVCCPDVAVLLAMSFTQYLFVVFFRPGLEGF